MAADAWYRGGNRMAKRHSGTLLYRQPALSLMHPLQRAPCMFLTGFDGRGRVPVYTYWQGPILDGCPQVI